MTGYDSADLSGELRADAARRRAAELRAQADRLDAQADRVGKGNVGERLTAERLDVLDGAGWRVLNDRWKSAGSTANIDHIVVGPPGVFVIDSKNWSAAVTVDHRGLTADGYGRQEDVDKLMQQAMAVRLHTSHVVPVSPVYPLMCFTSATQLSGPSPVGGVCVLELPSLLPWLTTHAPALSPQQVHQLASSLDVAFPPRTEHRPTRVRTRRASRSVAAPTRSRRRPSRRRRSSPLERAKLAVAVVVLGMLATGNYGAFATWFSDAAGSLIPKPTVTPAPKVVPPTHGAGVPAR